MLLVLLTLGCRNWADYSEILPTPPTKEGQLCEVTNADQLNASSGDERLGFSTELLSIGQSNSDRTLYRLAVAGAPGPDSHAGAGGFRTIEVDKTTGWFTSSPMSQQWASPDPSVTHFGWAVQAADIAVCTSSGAHKTYCGQELFVGAPDLQGDGPGRVFLYRQDSAANGNLAFYGELPAPPSGPPALARFGTAIAAPGSPSPSVAPTHDEPWKVALWAPWVAVGAPGEGAVHVYSTDYVSKTTSWVQTLVAPSSASASFGSTLTVGDFDQDNQWDLAVASPDEFAGSPRGGRVFVYRGLGGGVFDTSPLELSGAALWKSGSPEPDEYGAALDAGRMLQGSSLDVLVVGVPGHLETFGASAEEGGVCWYRFDSSPFAVLSERCEANPGYLGGTVADNRFGEALALGNFLSEDEAGRTSTGEALAMELAVSEPGYNGQEGRVQVWLSGPDFQGVDFSTYIADLSRPALGTSEFGGGISAGYTQDTPWQDLLIGAPLAPASVDGHITTTQAVATSSPCSSTSLYGYWTLEDTEGEDVDVLIKKTTDGDTIIAFGEGFSFTMIDEDTGATCVAEDDGDTFDVEGDLPQGTMMSLDGELACGDLVKTFHNQDIGGLVKGILVGTGDWGSLNPKQQADAESITGHVRIELTPATGSDPAEISIRVFALALNGGADTGDTGGGDGTFWWAVSVLMNTTDGTCVPDPSLDPLSGSWSMEATCED